MRSAHCEIRPGENVTMQYLSHDGSPGPRRASRRHRAVRRHRTFANGKSLPLVAWHLPAKRYAAAKLITLTPGAQLKPWLGRRGHHRPDQLPEPARVTGSRWTIG
jgi:hypothetical protein